ncbi:MAG: hemagglutinin protein, partial [Verrucomicrobiaceae bacterium]|nr:hemagglutinin protein [Verrucomicrobiaceae bacterium]
MVPHVAFTRAIFLATLVLQQLTLQRISAAAPGVASALVQRFSLPDDGPSPSDSLGSAMAMDGSSAIVGAPYDAALGRAEAGSAYILAQSGSPWIKQAKLRADDFALRSHFGSCVAISGDTAVVGAAPSAYSFEQGAVYVFVRSGTIWTQQARIEVSSLPANAVGYGGTFPAAIAVSGDSLVVSVNGPYGSTAESAYVFIRTGLAWHLQSSLHPSQTSVDQKFGSSLAMSGNTIVAGSAGVTVSSKYSSGAAFVFTRAGGVWTQQAMITASDGAAYDYFGTSVALDGDTLMAGAPGRDSTPSGPYSSGQGGAYLYTRTGTTWSETAKLLAPVVGSDNPGAGRKVALVGSVAIMGLTKPAYNYGTQAYSMAWAFNKGGSTWAYQGALTMASGRGSFPSVSPGDLATNGNSTLLAQDYQQVYYNSVIDDLMSYQNTGGVWSAGTRVALPVTSLAKLGTAVWTKGGDALVGAPGDVDAAGKATGSVRVLASTSGVWAVQAKLTPVPAVEGGQFGQALARDGNVIVVGAAEAAYVFQFSNGAWSQAAILTASDGTANDAFGSSVAVLGNTILVGAPHKDYAIGQAYVFIHDDTGWTEVAQLAPASTVENDNFGSAVALTGNLALVSAPGGFGITTGGGVHVFQGGAAYWLHTAKLMPPTGTGRFGASLAVSGQRLLVSGEYDDAVDSLHKLGGYGFEWQAGHWTGGNLWMSTPGSTIATVALDGGMAMIAGTDNDGQGFSYLFAQRSDGWSQADLIPGLAAALSGSTILVGNTGTGVGAAESGSATFYAPAATLAVFDDTDPATPEIDYAAGVSLGSLVTGKSYPHSFTLRNTGILPLTGLQASVGGGHPADLTLGALQALTIAPGGSLRLWFTVAPSTSSFDAAITLKSSDPNKSSLTIPVVADIATSGSPPVFSNEPGTGYPLNDPAAPITQVTLATSITGTLPLTLQWRKNGKAIPGATHTTLSLGRPVIGLVGSYSVEARNPYGTITSIPTTLYWIMPAAAPQNLTLNEGGTLTLNAPVQGAANAGWYFETQYSSGQLTDDTTHVFGSTSARLVIRGLTPGDAGNYYALLGNQQVIVARVTVRAKPRLEADALPVNSTFNWHVGSAVFGGPFFSGAAGIRFSAAGLPPGVTFDTVLGSLGGRPTVAGSYHASFSATNVAGAVTPVKVIINVSPLDP